MKIKSLQLKNFKRFTDLTLQGIPEQAKLVLLIGSNGSGKSSVFDAFNFFSKMHGGNHYRAQFIDFNNYYKKDQKADYEIGISFHNREDLISKNFNYSKNKLPKSIFYGRTSFRQIPVLTRTSLGVHAVNIPDDSDKPIAFIDRDERFENDIERITAEALKEFYRTDTPKEEIKEKYINPVNKALENIFGVQNGTALSLLEIIPPLEGKVAQINFKKGSSIFHYNQLSAGEKEVTNILFNFLARREYFNDTIFFFDEIDLHLNTKLQYNLLKEITENWIPDNCQFWTASHSLGFIQYAKDSEQAVIFDFDDYDFDQPRILTPEPKEKSELYEIAVGKEFLPALFENFNIVFVEGNDTKYFGELKIPKTVFVPENGRNGVYHKVKTGQFKGIVDKDFLSDEDIEQIEKEYPGVNVLRYYSIENYLYHPDNMEEHALSKGASFDKVKYIQHLTAAKNQAQQGISRSVSLKRTEYPYFGEPDYNGKPLQNRFKNKGENEAATDIIAAYLESDDFETFYKSFPMKSYATHLEERQNISKTDLAKTNWFKQQIESIIK